MVMMLFECSRCGWNQIGVLMIKMMWFDGVGVAGIK